MSRINNIPFTLEVIGKGLAKQLTSLILVKCALFTPFAICHHFGGLISNISGLSPNMPHYKHKKKYNQLRTQLAMAA